MPYVFPSEEMVLTSASEMLRDAAAAEAMVNRATRTARRNEEVDSTFFQAVERDAQNHSVREIAETDNIQSLALSDQEVENQQRNREFRA